MVLTHWGAAPEKKPVLRLETTRDFTEMITSTGAKFWWRFGPSRPVLAISTSPIFGLIFVSASNNNSSAHTNRGVQQRTLLRRVLRRVLETAFEKVLRRVLRRCLAMGFNGKKGSEKGS